MKRLIKCYLYLLMTIFIITSCSSNNLVKEKTDLDPDLIKALYTHDYKAANRAILNVKNKDESAIWLIGWLYGIGTSGDGPGCNCK